MSAATTEEIHILWSSDAHKFPRKFEMEKNIYKSPLHPLSATATEQKGEYIAKLCDMSKFHVVHQCVRKLYQNNNSQIYIIQKRQIRKRNK